MTKDEAINKVLDIALAEEGYLEKKSNSQLDSKTANAGSNNYTKYWRDVQPSFQTQPYCACFVTWCLMKAFDKAIASTILHHFPYVYCPTGKSQAVLHNEWYNLPQKGDIIIFKNSSNVCSHTGIVYAVDNNRVYTIEGNTSGGSTVIANGGAVCKKSYVLGYSRIAGYWRIDYDYAAEKMTAKETPKITEYTNIDEIAWELNHLGIVSDKSGLIAEVAKAPNSRLYWLARKLCHAIRLLNGKAETVKVSTYTDINAIAWDLNARGIVEDKSGLIADVKKEPNGRLYWLARKGLDYLRKRD